VPIAFFIATKDRLCPHENALEYIPLIQSQTTIIDVEGAGHSWFKTETDTEWFMENLIPQL